MGRKRGRERRGKGAEEYLLERRLFRRKTTGEPADAKFLEFVHPDRWRYNVLRALDYFRTASLWEEEMVGGRGSVGAGSGVGGAAEGGEEAGRPDLRLEEAVEHVRSKRKEDGRWNLDWALHRGGERIKVKKGAGEALAVDHAPCSQGVKVVGREACPEVLIL